MRALCGAVISAGAMIGLGLSAIGLGTRYASYIDRESPGGPPLYIRWAALDTPMMVILVCLLVVLLIGLAIAFMGLAFHHERRHHERLHALGRLPAHDPAVPRPLP